jgi:3-phosphoshikimate 1-carboxyvinyltransferase
LGPLDAWVRLPGSKSLTARYLVLAALADGPSRIDGVLRARDSDLMEDALAALGARISHPTPDAVVVVPAARPGHAAGQGDVGPATGLPSVTVDVGLAGTVMRFVPPLAAVGARQVQFSGDPAAASRPITPLLDALESLGATVDRPPPGASLPFSVTGQGSLAGGQVRLNSSGSSQFLSALLLAAPRFANGLEVTLDPPELPSRPHANMTLRCLAAFGGRARQTSEWSWRVEPGGLTGRLLAAEPDLSNAGPFLAAALVAGGTVRVAGWPLRTDQPGDLLRGYLEAFGAKVTWAAPAAKPTGAGPAAPDGAHPDGEVGQLSVSAPGGAISGVRLDLSPAGELAPTLAALATLADSPSRLRGIGHLRGHETDRLAALTSEINRLGGDARELSDGLEIHPRPLRGALVRTYGDHRMATFGALIGLAVPGVEVEDIAATAKTLPGFTSLWREMMAA